MKKFLFVISLMIMLCGISYAKTYSTVCANHILVPTEADAVKIKSQINSFEDFQYYAKKYSSCPSSRQGGALGCFQRGQMVKPFEEATFNGEVGTVSEPVKTQFGYHLIWVTKKY